MDTIVLITDRTPITARIHIIAHTLTTIRGIIIHHTVITARITDITRGMVVIPIIVIILIPENTTDPFLTALNIREAAQRDIHEAVQTERYRQLLL